MTIVMVFVLALAALALGRRGFWLTSAVCWALLGVLIVGTGSPVAGLARGVADAVTAGWTAFVTSLGETL